jgi:alpha-L-fucosidase 2
VNAELGRRTFIRSAAATGVAAAGTTWAAGTASAAPAGPAGQGAATGLSAHESSLRDARMVWSQAPRDRVEAPFLGDGALAVQVFLRPDGKALRFSLGPAGSGWDRASAFLDLVPAGAVTAVRLELDLWNAELSGMVSTASGSLAIRAFVPRGHGVLLVASTAAGGERAARFDTGADGAAADGTEVTRAVRQSGTHAVVTASAGQGDVRGALDAGEAALTAGHRAWWHDFYTRSYLSVPDRTVQRFHWIQLYTAAGLLSPRAPLAQSAPTLLNRSAHTDLGGVVAAAAGGALPPGAGHVNWAPPGAGSKAGPSANLLLAWGVPQVWDAYRHTGDEKVLREVLHPLLRKAVGFYGGFLVPGADGHLHLPATYSPGYGDVVDATHDLSLLRWATTTLIESTRRLGLSEPGLARWQDIAARLAPYHRDADGVSVGAGVRLARSHARAGHLLWLFPLYEKRWSRPADRSLMTGSFDHWASMRQDWDGRSYAVGASMAAAVRESEQALALLHHLLDEGPAGATRLLPNTVCRKGASGDLETPFAAGQAVLDLLVAGDPDVVDVFPGVPRDWSDASVLGLRAPGPFVVDAARSQGRTDWVRVRSESGRTLTLRHGIDDADVDIRVAKGGASRPADARSTAPGTCVVRLGAGESVVVARHGAEPTAEAYEVPANGGGRRWGGES